MNDLVPLEQAHCIPRRGNEHRLGQARLAELLPQVPGWELVEDGHALSRTFPFENYYETMAFVNALAWVATAWVRSPPFTPCWQKGMTPTTRLWTSPAPRSTAK